MENTPKRAQNSSIRFPLDVLALIHLALIHLALIRTLAKQHERSFNGEVVWALREYAERHKGEQ